ncbi:MAG: hypothetical protein ACJ76L_10595 [Conexibacter sp.]
MSVEVLPELDRECFFIAPIGDEGSEMRDRSDGVLEYIVVPAVETLDLTAIRADKIAKPGMITRQVIEHVVGARAAVVDLTGANPNVYYEMAVRHTAQLPTVLICQHGEKLPFDIAQMRTIFFDHTNLKSAAECKDQITQHLREALAGEVDSPIASSVSVQRLEQGTPQERVLAQVADGIDEIRRSIERLGRHDRTDPRAMADLAEAMDELLVWRQTRAAGDPELDEVIESFSKPVGYFTRNRALRERRRRFARPNEPFPRTPERDVDALGIDGPLFPSDENEPQVADADDPSSELPDTTDSV